MASSGVAGEIAGVFPALFQNNISFRRFFFNLPYRIALHRHRRRRRIICVKHQRVRPNMETSTYVNFTLPFSLSMKFSLERIFNYTRSSSSVTVRNLMRYRHSPVTNAALRPCTRLRIT